MSINHAFKGLLAALFAAWTVIVEVPPVEGAVQVIEAPLPEMSPPVADQTMVATLALNHELKPTRLRFGLHLMELEVRSPRMSGCVRTGASQIEKAASTTMRPFP